MSSLDIARREFGQTDHNNYKDTGNQSHGDLLRDTLDLDERMSVAPALRLLAHELHMLSIGLLSDDGPNEEICELVLHNVERRLQVLAEVEDRMRSALDGKIETLEGMVDRLGGIIDNWRGYKDPAASEDPAAGSEAGQ